jgi:FtsX-like permease family
MSLLKLAFKRLVAQRMLAVALLITMAFAIGVLAAGPIYADASREAILRGEVAQSDPTVKDVRFTLNPTAGLDQNTTEARVNSVLRGLPAHRVVFEMRTPPLTVSGPRGTIQTFMLYRDGGLKLLHYTAGQAPTLPGQLAVEESFRTVLGGVGDSIVVSTGQGPTLTYHISGLYQEPRARDPRWFGTGAPFPQEGNPTSPSTPPMVGVRDSVGLAIGQLNLDGTQRYDWDVYLKVEDASLDQLASYIPRVTAAGTAIRSTPGLSGVVATTGLDALVDLIRQETNHAILPIYLVVLQIGAVALAVLAGVASLALSNQSFELAVLKSRGFSRRQLLAAQTMQTALAAAFALPLGLVIGLLLALLGEHAHGPLLPGVTFHVSLSFLAVMVGIGAALVGVGLVFLVTIPHVSRTVVEERRATSREDRPLLLRFPIELIILPVGLFSLLEARSRGLEANAATGSLDPLVLLAPTLLLFAASFAALRLFAWSLRRADGTIGSISNFPAYLVGRRLARSASAGFASSLLLILAAGLLVISSSYRATVLQSYSDLAHQQIGADWQVAVDSPTQSLVALRKLPPRTTGVFIGETDLPNASFATSAATIGVDPERFAEGGWWRADYADRSLGDLMDSIRTPLPGSPVKAGPLTIDVTADKALAGYQLEATVLQPNGVVTIVVKEPMVAGQHVYTGTAPGGARLLSITLARPEFTLAPDEVTLTINAVDGTPGLPRGQAWGSLPWLSSTTEFGGGAAAGAVQLTIRPGSGQVIGGVSSSIPRVPVLASSDVVSSVGRDFEGIVAGTRLPVHVVSVLRGFPAAPPGQPFLVVPEQVVLARLMSIPEATQGITQVWASGSDSPAAAIRQAGLHVNTVTSSVALERRFTLNPQSLALGMHYTAAVGGMVLVVIGVGVGLYFAQRRRRFEFATLRALGTERRTMLAVMIGEQAAIVGFSLIAAFLLSGWLLRLMMPALGPSIARGFPSPLLVTDWRAVAVFTIAVLIAAGVSLALAIRATLGSSVTSVLRGEVE